MDETKTDVANSEMSIDVVGLHYARRRASEVLSKLEDLDIYNNILSGIDDTCIDLLIELETLQKKTFGQLDGVRTQCYSLIETSDELIKNGDSENKPGLNGIINYMDDMRNRLSFMDASTASHFEFLDQVDNYGEDFADDEYGLTSQDEAMITQFQALQSKPREEWTDEDYAKYNECISYDPDLVYASLKPSFEAIMAKPESEWTAQDREFINQYLYYEYAVMDQSGELSYDNYMNTSTLASDDDFPVSKMDYVYGNIEFDESGVWVPVNSWDRAAVVNYLGYDPGPITREVMDYIMSVRDSRNAAREAKMDVYADFTRNKTTIYDDYTDFGWIEDLYHVYSVAGTIVCGFAEGVIKVGENIVDGAVMLGGGAYSLYFEALDWVNDQTGNVVPIDFGEYAQWTRDATTTIVSYDAAGNLYNVVTGEILHLDEDIAQGGLRTLSNMGGTVVGYTLLNTVTGGAGTVWVVSTSALAAAGSSAENSFGIVGADGSVTTDEFYRVLGKSTIDAGVGAVSGAGVDKAGAMYNQTGNWLYRLAASGSAMVEPVVGGAGEYLLIANGATDADGNPLYEDWNDYASKTGFYTSVSLAGGIGWLSSGFNQRDSASTRPSAIDNDRVPVYYYNMYGDPGLDARNLVQSSNYEIPGLAYESRVQRARDAAVDYYGSNRPDWLDDATFDSKVASADAMAIRFEQEGIMTREKFYEIWGTPKGQRPDPSTYLPDGYIKNHLRQFETEGAARLVDGDTYINRVASNGGLVGNPNAYDVDGVHYNSSEFMSTRSSIDTVISKANGSSNFEASVVHDLGLTDWELSKYQKTGIMRYDVSGSNLSGLNARIPSGNEPGAFLLDWIPGGRTSGGSVEIIIDRFNLNDTGNELTKIK